MATTPWRRFEELRPDELAEMVAATPAAFWPLGLLEHHGWHLPVGFDGIKAERMCVRIAERMCVRIAERTGGQPGTTGGVFTL